MIKKAIEKLKSEMDKEKNNPYIQVVGEYLLKIVEGNPGAAEKVVATDKTIKNSLNEMSKAAEKKKVGNCAVLTDQEGFGIVLKYFGIDVPTTEITISTTKVAKKTETIDSASNKNIDFDIKLEDFI